MTDAFNCWKETLFVLKPETLIRWHQQGFRLYWRWKSRSEPGRPKIPQAHIDFSRQMANGNPLWGAPRIHGEMLKLGFDISESTVLRDMSKTAPRTTRRRWKTFLKNHSAKIISLDYFVVPTITFAKTNPRWSIHDQQFTAGGKEKDVEVSKKWKMESNIW
jgi:hypothetical protein